MLSRTSQCSQDAVATRQLHPVTTQRLGAKLAPSRCKETQMQEVSNCINVLLNVILRMEHWMYRCCGWSRRVRSWSWEAHVERSEAGCWYLLAYRLFTLIEPRSCFWASHSLHPPHSSHAALSGEPRVTAWQQTAYADCQKGQASFTRASKFSILRPPTWFEIGSTHARGVFPNIHVFINECIRIFNDVQDVCIMYMNKLCRERVDPRVKWVTVPSSRYWWHIPWVSMTGLTLKKSWPSQCRYQAIIYLMMITAWPWRALLLGFIPDLCSVHFVFLCKFLKVSSFKKQESSMSLTSTR